MVQSLEEEQSRSPCAENAHAVTLPSWPVSTALHALAAVSHTRIVVSLWEPMAPQPTGKRERGQREREGDSERVRKGRREGGLQEGMGKRRKRAREKEKAYGNEIAGKREEDTRKTNSEKESKTERAKDIKGEWRMRE